MTPSGELWGGRFSAPPDPDLFRITASIDIDMLLLPYDLAATKAHARMLEKAGILDGDGVAAVEDACDQILVEVNAGELAPTAQDEDVHSFVERTLTERVGMAGAQHPRGPKPQRSGGRGPPLVVSCRSDGPRAPNGRLDRNSRGHRGSPCRHAHARLHASPTCPARVAWTSILRLTGSPWYATGIVSGQLRRRQSVFAARGRCSRGDDPCPSIPPSRQRSSASSSMFDNAMDAVSDRDFVCDLAYAAALCGVHLSRLAEEIVLWTSGEFGFARLDDAWSTGSSMMPQKRNPDVAELTRGRAAPGIGESDRVADDAQGPSTCVRPRSAGRQGVDLRASSRARGQASRP